MPRDLIDLRGPVDEIRSLITKHGGYGFVRTQAMAAESGRRLCSSGSYPCTHRGLDLAVPEGTEVLAPEHGFVLYAIDGDDVRPYSRYGPAVIVLAGASGYFHVIAHLAEPNPIGDYRTNDLIPRAQPLSTPLLPAYRADGSDTTYTGETGPTERMPTFEIEAGGSLGYVSTARHVHWEVRRRPTDRTTVINPIDWMLARSSTEIGAGSGLGWLLLAGAYLYSKRGKR